MCILSTIGETHNTSIGIALPKTAMKLVCLQGMRRKEQAHLSSCGSLLFSESYFSFLINLFTERQTAILPYLSQRTASAQHLAGHALN